MLYSCDLQCQYLFPDKSNGIVRLADSGSTDKGKIPYVPRPFKNGAAGESKPDPISGANPAGLVKSGDLPEGTPPLQLH
jgi:hypothetical protein